LVIAIEGTSLKPKLPEVRWGSKVPFWFQILDYDVVTKAWTIRQRNTVELQFAENPNECTLPAECVDPDAEVVKEGASPLASFVVASLALASLSVM